MAGLGFRTNIACVVVAAFGLTCGAQCLPQWQAQGRIGDVADAVFAEAVGTVTDLTTIDNDGVRSLVVAGRFTVTRDGPAAGVARYDGSSWVDMSAGAPPLQTRFSLAWFGGELFLANDSYICGGAPQGADVYRWNGAAWEPLPVAPLTIEHLVVVNNGLYAIGESCGVDGANHVAYRWQSGVWVPTGPEMVEYSFCHALAMYNGELVYAGEGLRTALASPALSIAVDRTGLQTLGPGLGGTVNSLVVRGDLLIASGWFGASVDQPGAGFATWNGSAWAALSPALPIAETPVDCRAIGVGDDLFLTAGITGPGNTVSYRAWRLSGGVYTELATGGRALVGGTDFGSAGTALAQSGAIDAADSNIFTLKGDAYLPLAERVGIAPKLFATYDARPIAIEAGQGLSRVWKFRDEAWERVGEDLPFEARTAGECGGQLLVISEPNSALNVVGARWDGTQWIDVPGVPQGYIELVKLGSELFAVGREFQTFPLQQRLHAYRWNGLAWELRTDSPLDRKEVVFSDGVRALIGWGFNQGAITDGWSLSVLPALNSNPPQVSGAFAGDAVFQNAAGPSATYQLVNGAWVKVRDARSAMIGYRNTLYRDDSKRWEIGSWVDDDLVPAFAFTAPAKSRLSCNGDLWLARSVSTIHGVTSAGTARATCNCKADLTGDGAQELDDYVAFFNAWEVGGRLADLNFDGTVDLLDFFFFFENWDIGCGA